jgi:hypothetical protein
MPNKKSPVITLKQLEEFGACESQRILFKARFGESVKLTKKVILKHQHEFNLYWLSVFALNAANQKRLSEETSEAYNEYWALRTEVMKEYDNWRNKNWRSPEYTVKLIKESEKCNTKIVALRENRYKKEALIFYRIYKEQCNAV